MTDAARARRLADRIQEIAAAFVELRVKDPRLGFVTITDARVTSDLRDATVFYTVYGDEQARTDSAAALASATGVVRAEVGRQTGLRFTPTVTFVADVVPDSVRSIDELLAKARAADEQVHAIAAGAQPAGDPDPYRSLPEDSGEEAVS